MNWVTRAVRGALDRSLVPVLNYLRYRTHTAVPEYSVLQELAARTASECADYVQRAMPRALQFSRREELWEHAWSQTRATGLVAEFGVWNGYSINQFAKKTDRIVYGFDSFSGLQEDWAGAGFAKGKFNLAGNLPKVRKNVELVKGWFHETLPGFLASHGGDFAFLHVDCDTYEAARTVLDLAGPRIQPGCIVVFDEYFGYRGWKCGEYKAWQEFVAREQICYEYLAFSTSPVSLQVTQRRVALPPDHSR